MTFRVLVTGATGSALRYWAGLVDEPEPVTHTIEEITGRSAHTFATWATDHADDFRL
jgi:hypothetical protein